MRAKCGASAQAQNSSASGRDQPALANVANLSCPPSHNAACAATNQSCPPPHNAARAATNQSCPPPTTQKGTRTESSATNQSCPQVRSTTEVGEPRRTCKECRGGLQPRPPRATPFAPASAQSLQCRISHTRQRRRETKLLLLSHCVFTPLRQRQTGVPGRPRSRHPQAWRTASRSKRRCWPTARASKRRRPTSLCHSAGPPPPQPWTSAT